MSRKALVVLTGSKSSRAALAYAANNYDELEVVTFDSSYNPSPVTENRKLAEAAGAKRFDVVMLSPEMLSQSDDTNVFGSGIVLLGIAANRLQLSGAKAIVVGNDFASVYKADPEAEEDKRVLDEKALTNLAKAIGQTAYGDPDSVQIIQPLAGVSDVTAFAEGIPNGKDWLEAPGSVSESHWTRGTAGIQEKGIRPDPGVDRAIAETSDDDSKKSRKKKSE